MPLPAVSEKEYVAPDDMQHADADVLPAELVPAIPLYDGHAVHPDVPFDELP
ncbi:MAG: hypothetical protein IJY77_00860 [Alphaproteobacteria bacterium]|nr:hypothetical protein [Alphaproteobacteria bacterium]